MVSLDRWGSAGACVSAVAVAAACGGSSERRTNENQSGSGGDVVAGGTGGTTGGAPNGGTTTCPASRGDCDGDPSVCETNTDESISNCGACGRACTAEDGQVAFCRQGECETSSCGPDASDASCTYDCELPPDAPANDPPFEGSCRMGCPFGSVCVAEIVSGVPGGEYCAPLPRGCLGSPSCACITGCVCPGDMAAVRCDTYGAGLDGVSGPLTIACVRP
jgi:hypothetical protein